MVQVLHYRQVPPEDAAEGVSMRLIIGPQEGAPFFNMRLFEVQPGQATPYHDHWWEHEAFVLSGQGLVRTEGHELPIGPQSAVFVPGNERHQFRNTGDGILRFLCLVPQEWLEGVPRPPG